MKLFLCISLVTISMYSCAQLPDPPQPSKQEKKALTQGVIFDVCGCMCEPEFPGGSVLMREYLSTNLNYPEEALKNRETGRVWVNYVVDVDGSITNVEIALGISASLDQEAMRVVRSMPHWIPGYDVKNQRGVKINVRQPINFELKY